MIGLLTFENRVPQVFRLSRQYFQLFAAEWHRQNSIDKSD